MGRYNLRFRLRTDPAWAEQRNVDFMALAALSVFYDNVPVQGQKERIALRSQAMGQADTGLQEAFTLALRVRNAMAGDLALLRAGLSDGDDLGTAAQNDWGDVHHEIYSDHDYLQGLNGAPLPRYAALKHAGNMLEGIIQRQGLMLPDLPRRKPKLPETVPGKRKPGMCS